MKHAYRISQITEWTGAFAGQSCIALINGAEVISRFSTWGDARKAYRAALTRP